MRKISIGLSGLLASALFSASLLSSLAWADGTSTVDGPDYDAGMSQVAAYVDRILKGAKPSELPIEQVSKYELVVNLRFARELGIEIPQSILVRADEVIR